MHTFTAQSQLRPHSHRPAGRSAAVSAPTASAAKAKLYNPRHPERTQLNRVLRIFLRVIAQTLQTHSPGAANMDKATLHIGAVALLHRFGFRLNGHVHFHVCVVDGVFEKVAGCVIFHPASAIGCPRRAPPGNAMLACWHRTHRSGQWWRPEAHHRVHHALCRHQAHTRSHRGGVRAPAHRSGTRATLVG